MTENKVGFSSKKPIEKDGFSPLVFTTQPKNNRKPKTKSLEISKDGIANSRLLSIEQELGLNGLFDGEVYHLSFDCPKPLAEAFKQATHDNGTSICKELQKYALSYVAVYHAEKSAFGNTLSRILKPKLTIENLNFEQYCQSRPRRYIRKDDVRAVSVDGVKGEFCGIGDCGNVAVGSGVYLETNRVYRLCELHLKEYSARAMWRCKLSLSQGVENQLEGKREQ